MDYRGKKVLMTGAASGIGRQIALAYAQAGALVIVADKDYEGDRFVREELRPLVPDCCFFHCDLALASACENLMQSIFEQLDDLDIIINNAGVSQFCSLWEETAEHWDYVLNSNLRSIFLVSRDYMINRRNKGYKERYGRIVNISSTRSMMSEEGTEAYTASKGGDGTDPCPGSELCPLCGHGQLHQSRLDLLRGVRSAGICRPPAAPVRTGGTSGGCGVRLPVPHR